MRGSVWVKIKGYITNKDNSVRTSSFEVVYAYGGVTDLNTSYQKQLAFEKSLSKALATYREHHNLDSDDEVNYYLLDDGIQYQDDKYRYTTKKGKVYHGIRYRQTKLTSKQKRESHRKVIGKTLIVRPEDLARQYEQSEVDVKPKQFREITSKEYLQSTKNLKQPQGRLLKPPIVKRKNVRGYWGMNREASKELKLKLKSQPKDNEIWIDKSLKGKKARQVIAHEVYERKLMKKGMKYKQAHKKATQYEKKIK